MPRKGFLDQAVTPMAMKPKFLVDTDGKDRLTCEVLYDYGAVTLGAGAAL